MRIFILIICIYISKICLGQKNIEININQTSAKKLNLNIFDVYLVYKLDTFFLTKIQPRKFIIHDSIIKIIKTPTEDIHLLIENDTYYFPISLANFTIEKCENIKMGIEKSKVNKGYYYYVKLCNIAGVYTDPLIKYKRK